MIPVAYNILKNSQGMMRYPLQHVVNAHRDYGNVFRMNLPGRSMVVLAGLEANRLLAKSNDLLRNDVSFGAFANELNDPMLLIAIDGSEHRGGRKLQRRGYSRSALLPHLSTLESITASWVGKWEIGDVFSVVSQMRYLIAYQLGVVMANYYLSPDDFDQLSYYFSTALKVHTGHSLPAIALRTPRYKRSKARAMEIAREVIQWHRMNPPTDRPLNLVDDLIVNVEDENHLLASTLGIFVAGLDTVANVCTYVLYALAKYPGLAIKIRDELSHIDSFSHDKLKDMETLHHTILESLRMYPVAPFTIRRFAHNFDFDGHVIFENETAMFANTVTHFLPEYFPDPTSFNITRFSTDRAEHKKTPQAFAPYTLGAHTCLGAGLAEIQMMITIATIVKHMRFTLPDPTFKMISRLSPSLTPTRKFELKVINKI